MKITDAKKNQSVYRTGLLFYLALPDKAVGLGTCKEASRVLRKRRRFFFKFLVTTELEQQQ